MADVPPISEWTDPRILRTRQMLFGALEHLLGMRSIEQISVADIAEQATLNRATFYDHYPDKFALLEGLAEARFHELLSRRHVIFDGSCPSALMAVTLATCDYLAPLHGGECSKHRQMEKHLEAATSGILRALILGGLRTHEPQGSVPVELVAATISGAIYGAAREWARTPNRVPVDEVVGSIFAMVGPMMLGDAGAAPSQ